MTQIEDAVKKLFSNNKWTETEKDPNHIDFIKRAIKEAPNCRELNLDRTSDDIIKDFLFENTEIGKTLKKIIEKYKYESIEEEHS